MNINTMKENFREFLGADAETQKEIREDVSRKVLSEVATYGKFEFDFTMPYTNQSYPNQPELTKIGGEMLSHIIAPGHIENAQKLMENYIYFVNA